MVCSGGEFQTFLAHRHPHPTGTFSVLLVCSCIKIFCGSSLALQGGVVDFFVINTFSWRKRIGSLVVQSGGFNTEYGTKNFNFFVNTLDYIKVSDGPFRHFDKTSVNVNTMITFSKRKMIKEPCALTC
jgi:hypothetical protein